MFSADMKIKLWDKIKRCMLVCGLFDIHKKDRNWKGINLFIENDMD